MCLSNCRDRLAIGLLASREEDFVGFDLALEEGAIGLGIAVPADLASLAIGHHPHPHPFTEWP